MLLFILVLWVLLIAMLLIYLNKLPFSRSLITSHELIRLYCNNVLI